MFREVTTLPLETFVNEGGHRVDLAARTIFNDEHWKGWLPKGLVFRDIFARLATGYAKRFWKQGNRYLGETLYVDGRIRSSTRSRSSRWIGRSTIWIPASTSCCDTRIRCSSTCSTTS